MPVQRPYNPNARLMAEMIQADWARIGVKAKIVSYEWGAYLKRAQNGEHGAILIDHSPTPDPNAWFVTLSCNAVHGDNQLEWCYPPFEALLRRAVQITDIR